MNTNNGQIMGAFAMAVVGIALAALYFDTLYRLYESKAISKEQFNFYSQNPMKFAQDLRAGLFSSHVASASDKEVIWQECEEVNPLSLPQKSSA